MGLELELKSSVLAFTMALPPKCHVSSLPC